MYVWGRKPGQDWPRKRGSCQPASCSVFEHHAGRDALGTRDHAARLERTGQRGSSDGRFVLCCQRPLHWQRQQVLPIQVLRVRARRFGLWAETCQITGTEDESAHLQLTGGGGHGLRPGGVLAAQGRELNHARRDTSNWAITTRQASRSCAVQHTYYVTGQSKTPMSSTENPPSNLKSSRLA